jgi:hypothetical protein
MQDEVAWVPRPPLLLQIGWQRAGDEVEGTQAPGDQAAVVQRARAEHAIVAFVDQVHDAVTEGGANREMGFSAMYSVSSGDRP